MVDISGFDVILDMDELTIHLVVSDCDMRRVIIRHDLEVVEGSICM